MKCEKVNVKPPFIKLDSFLKFAGACETGGHSKVLIKDGEVILNGEVCTLRGKKLYNGEKVEVMGQCFEVVILEG